MRPLKRRALVAPTSQLLDRGSDAGRSIIVPFNTRGPQDIISVVGDDEFARIMTVTLLTLGTVTPGTSIVGDPAVATVQFGVAGVQAVVEMDFLQNTVFSVPCSFLRVSAERELTPSSPVSDMRLAAFVTYGDRAGRNPQRTLRGVSELPASFPLVPGAVATFFVPRFSKTLRVGNRQGSPVNVLMTDAGNIPLYTVTQLAGEMSEIALSNDCRRIQVTNAGAVDITDMRLIFSLEL